MTTRRVSIPPALHLALAMRDGFVDRLDGGKPLYFTPWLRLQSMRDPERIPFHPNWKAGACHPDFWDCCLTADHIVPVIIGGTNDTDNLVSTNMRRNMAKSTTALDALSWQLAEPGDLADWDGGLQEFVDEVSADAALLALAWIKPWYRAALAAGLKPSRQRKLEVVNR